ncbi:CoA transferase [Bradyrhizobium sp. LHD-71]|uniref:CaiB/BaiF CoA transferase family protein n=1 Tax=Bradyrhizobium sp. LHD-71 TaxID=3072141 RepID=UPI00280FFEBD|nr:CoA transferase [Bradyrhizobium sp. LHD-71]MDQ8731050.1 CoA transferase [Bradyrhizobium sp. LHD-71]
MSQGLFEGLKVIDCASYIAAPAAATVLSDFGAEIIKIEPLTGDPYRIPGQPPVGARSPVNPNWLMDSRNKKSLAINIASDSGRDVLYKLVAEADVFITNFPPNVRKRLRLTYDDISALNPRLIYASFTGYGESGPEANKPGFDATVWWARSGMMDLVRAGDAAPVRSPPGMGDHPSAMGFYSAIVTALYRREKTGKGAHVGSSLLANGLWANACSVQSALCGDTVERQPARAEHMMPWRNSYRCSDGKWLVLSIVHNDGRWDVFRTAVQSPLLDDPRFQTTADRKEHAIALASTLDKIFAEKTAAEWGAILDHHGVVFGAVYAMSDVPNDEQAKISGALVPSEDGSMLTVSSPFWIEGEDKTKPKRAPTIGQHNEEVLSAAGFSADDVRKLRDDGIVK